MLTEASYSILLRKTFQIVSQLWINVYDSLRDIYNYLEAYLGLSHLSKIEAFPVVNLWEALNIFSKKIHLGCLIGLWMPLSILIVYLVAKKYIYILSLGKLIDEEDKYTRSAENCHL